MDADEREAIIQEATRRSVQQVLVTLLATVMVAMGAFVVSRSAAGLLPGMMWAGFLLILLGALLPVAARRVAKRKARIAASFPVDAPRS